jgi:cobalt-precorrin-5B (C1)-methyltransferase
MTHYTRSTVDTGLLGRLTREVTGDEALASTVDGANTARHAYELWDAAGVLRQCGDELCARVADVLTRFGDGRLGSEVAMVDFSGHRVVAATRAEWVA